jgi:hypothetical protein
MFRRTQKKGGKVVQDSHSGAEIIRAKRPRPKENPEYIQSKEQCERPAMGLVFVKPQGSLEALREKHKQSYIEAKLVDPALEAEEPTANEDPDSVFDTMKRLKSDEEYKADKINWVTGLIEVPLSMKHKLDNIEATEQAKRRLFYDSTVEDSRFDDIHAEEYEHFHGERLKAKKEELEFERLETLMFGKSRARRKNLEKKRKENAMAEAVSQALCRDSI